MKYSFELAVRLIQTNKPKPEEVRSLVSEWRMLVDRCSYLESKVIEQETTIRKLSSENRFLNNLIGEKNV